MYSCSHLKVIFTTHMRKNVDAFHPEQGYSLSEVMVLKDGIGVEFGQRGVSFGQKWAVDSTMIQIMTQASNKQRHFLEGKKYNR